MEQELDKSQSLRRQFASDNYAGVCPEAWETLSAANDGHAPPYGNDAWTQQACDALRQLFETDCEVFFVSSGTAANALVVPCCASRTTAFCAMKRPTWKPMNVGPRSFFPMARKC